MQYYNSKRRLLKPRERSLNPNTLQFLIITVNFVCRNIGAHLDFANELLSSLLQAYQYCYSFIYIFIYKVLTREQIS